MAKLNNIILKITVLICCGERSQEYEFERCVSLLSFWTEGEQYLTAVLQTVRMRAPCFNKSQHKVCFLVCCCFNLCIFFFLKWFIKKDTYLFLESHKQPFLLLCVIQSVNSCFSSCFHEHKQHTPFLLQPQASHISSLQPAPPATLTLAGCSSSETRHSSMYF